MGGKVFSIIGFILSLALIWFFLALPYRHVYAREGDNHGNHGDLKLWFDRLASKKGLCCSFADGVSIRDVDWGTKEGHYIVKIPPTAVFPGSKDYIDVPDAAVVTEPNRYGPAVVWPYFDSNGTIQIRCFMPGTLS